MRSTPRISRPAARFAAPPLAFAALALAVAIAPAPLAAQVVTRNVELLSHFDSYPPGPTSPFGAGYSACWSYIHGDGREYAIIGTNDGTAFYNVTDPANAYFVGFISGPHSAWREMKSYRNWVYITSEGIGPGEGLQIVRMTNPEAPVLAATYTTGFTHSHTVQVDTARALLICNGTRDGSGQQTGMRILSIASPEAPVELSHWPNLYPVPGDYYVHDCVTRGNRLYVSSIYNGIERVFDLADPANPVLLNSWTYPGAYYAHSSWPDSTGRYLYVCDEQNGQALRVFDITNVMSPQLVNAITSNPQAIVHNPRVKGHELYLANYTEGLRVLTLDDPAHPAEFGFADSYPGTSGAYQGVWDVCPFFPSGTVIASDMQSGLYVYRITRDYGVLKVTVKDGPSGLPLPGVLVHLDPEGDSLATPADGIVRFAPSPGLCSVFAEPWGYERAQGSRIVSIGVHDSLTLELNALPLVSFSGVIRDANTSAPIPHAEVTLDHTPLHVHADGSGAFFLADVPEGLYSVRVTAAGYVPVLGARRIDASSTIQDYALAPTLAYDPLETDTGWSVGAPGDAASSGGWARVAPLGTGPRPPGQMAPQESASGVRETAATRPADERTRDMAPLHAQHDTPAATVFPNAAPYVDHTPGSNFYCFVTGQGTDTLDVDQADVDGGPTSLTSPAYDLSGMTDPIIGYWRWFLSTWVGWTDQPDPEDWLAVLISNNDGASWTPVDTTRGVQNHWVERTIRVNDYVTLTANVRIRFRAADLGPNTTVEAGVDDITIWDASTGALAVGGLRSAGLRFLPPRPNPSAGAVTLALEMPLGGALEVDVLDLAGRRVRALHSRAASAGLVTLRWDGLDDRGRPAPAGLYFARARCGGTTVQTRFVRTL